MASVRWQVYRWGSGVAAGKSYFIHDRSYRFRFVITLFQIWDPFSFEVFLQTSEEDRSLSLPLLCTDCRLIEKKEKLRFPISNDLILIIFFLYIPIGKVLA